MVRYGAKIGKSKAELNDAVWTALRSRAKPAHPFTLKRLDNHKPVSLSDYRGQVVIADFWYPNCGPCRASFPYLDKVAVQFQNRGLTVLAINGMEKQQPLAQPYLWGKGYHFIGLAGNNKFAEDAYGVRVYPSTFFIGPRGNILFQLHVSDDTTERNAEAAVKFMLTRAKDI
jgi:thiol-disulfide isomerase/thioredoxin